jgi:polysaccharide biosynthesis protein PslH
MKVLQLYYKMPFPQYDGGAISLYNSSLGLLSQGVELRVLAMNQYGSGCDLALIPEGFRHSTGFRAVEIDNRVKPLAAFRGLIRGTTYFAGRFRSTSFSEVLISILKENTFDIIQLEHLYLCLYLPEIRKHSAARVVLRPQNIEHQIWDRYYRGIKNPAKRGWLRLETEKLKRFETGAAQAVDAIIALSSKDADWFRDHAPGTPVTDVPIGVDLERFAENTIQANQGETPLFYHLGSMDWRPNVEGLEWFIREVMPLLKVRFPLIRIHLAGKHMPRWFFEQADENLLVEGMVPDAFDFQQDKAVMLVPLLSGSGIRVKIIEGMAMGKAIISTTIGAEGLPLEDGRNILIADTPERFVAQITRCLEEEGLCRKLGSSARELAMERFDLKQTGKAMAAFYHARIV